MTFNGTVFKNETSEEKRWCHTGEQPKTTANVTYSEHGNRETCRTEY